MHTRLAILLALSTASAALATQSATDTTVVRIGTLWDGNRVRTNVTLVVAGDYIIDVGGGEMAAPGGSREVDLRTYFVIPGMIDLHTHITYSWNGAPGTTPLKQGPRRTPGETASAAEGNARRTLEAGVTTARDLGASGGADYLVRDRVSSGAMIGPRLYVAGPGISAGRGEGPAPEAMRVEVENRVRAGSDWIKVYASRGSFQSVDTRQTLTFEQMKAIVDAAHALGRKVAIHSYGASGVKDAVRAGADSIEHGIELDDETLREMVKRRTVWVPTIDHNRYYVDAKDEYGFPQDAIPPLQAYIVKNLEATRRAVKAGVRLGMGSDAVYTMFGQNTRELAWFARAGMKPEEALRTATTIPADLLGMAGKLGCAVKGCFADLVAIEGDPLKDVMRVIGDVRLVIKAGSVVVDKREPAAGR
ncbi:MAG: amidohydrolase family protein [Vicinamibacterales bacterium]